MSPPPFDATRWFARLGLALTPSEVQLARSYLDAVGYGSDIAIAGVEGPAGAEAIIRSPAWDKHWWSAEAAERERLQSLADTALGRAAVLEHLTALATRHSDELQRAAEDRLKGAALSRAAAGAAALALHEHALAALVGAPADHLFMRKYEVFALGRWPLGVLQKTFHLY